MPGDKILHIAVSVQVNSASLLRRIGIEVAEKIDFKVCVTLLICDFDFTRFVRRLEEILVVFLNSIDLFYQRKLNSIEIIGTMIASTVNILVAWSLLTTIPNICRHELLPPNSPWTCPGDRVFFDASVLWGLVGPKRIFGSLGNYGALNWFFLGGLLGPVLVWLLHKAFPKQSWIPLINLPILLGAIANMPPATTLNYNAWVVVGTIFNFCNPVPQAMVADVQLCSFSCSRCWSCFYGSSSVLFCYSSS
ncbi:hypothetical protein IFM89_021946 [Coptis chinensis]|uniref:Uncharacterized protein n=1 Tax=Coptis chinensis TaxID=261450 RepID=A0A835HEU9_9MAGN|nr:hypothetical protein IFM89_021946 [Coptis chinensis]